jgi:hypothetical protein
MFQKKVLVSIICININTYCSILKDLYLATMVLKSEFEGLYIVYVQTYRK